MAIMVDESGLEEVFNTERHPLYVACTHARGHLIVTGVTPSGGIGFGKPAARS